MKRFLIIVFAMLALIVKAQKGNEVIVKVIDRDIANNKYLSVFKSDGIFISEVKVDTLISNVQKLTDTSYYVVIEGIKDPKLVRFRFLNQTDKAYLIYPKDTLSLDLSQGFTQKTNNLKAQPNRLSELSTFIDSLQVIRKFKELNNKAKTLDEAFNIIDSLYNSNKKYIDEVSGTKSQNILFKKILNDINNATQLWWIDSWVDVHKELSQKQLAAFIKKYYLPGKIMPSTPQTLYTNLYGYPILQSLDLLVKADTSDNDILVKKTQIINKYYSGQLKNYLLSYIYYIHSMSESPNLKLANDWYSLHEKKLGKESYNNLIDLAYYKLNLINKPLPDSVLNLRFIDGLKKATTLREILNRNKKAKILDIWATWCSACINAFKEGKDEVAQLKDEGIDFIYISIDKIEREKDMDTLAKVYGLNSYWLLEEDVKVFFKYFNIREIPRLLLVDTDVKLQHNALPAAGKQNELTRRVKQRLSY